MTDPAVSLEQRMLDAERRAREIAENAQAEAEAAREEAVRAREEAERAHRLETQARERLQVLVEAGVAMAASLEVRSVLSAATAAAARRVCDYSVAFAVDREGRVEAAVGAHRDPARFGMVERMANAHLPDPDDPDSIVANVLKTGEVAWIPNVPLEQMERMMAPGEQLELARSLGLASVIAVPLAARGRTLGVLVLVRDDPSTPFVEEDQSLAGMLAARAGLAVDNARLYAEREYVAETLRRSLLPPELPGIEGLEIAARYLPAAEGTQVGGDFYDVFEAAPDRWIAVMGDAVGKGAEAAAMMGLARYTIRTAAMSEGRPSAILETLNQAILTQTNDQRFCTACAVRLRPSGDVARATVCSGGHPLPPGAARGRLHRGRGEPWHDRRGVRRPGAGRPRRRPPPRRHARPVHGRGDRRTPGCGRVRREAPARGPDRARGRRSPTDRRRRGGRGGRVPDRAAEGRHRDPRDQGGRMTALGIDPVDTETGTVLRLSGELDLGTVAEAEDAPLRIENEGRGGITLDLRYLGFIDSTGLRFILSAHARAVEHDRPFAIVRASDTVHRVFVLTRLDERLPFVGAADPLPG